MSEKLVKPKKKKNYLTKQQMMDELEICQAQGRLTEQMGKYFMLLSERCVNHRDFVMYPFREDLISVAVTACCYAGLRFNPEQSNNPFGYFTTTIRRAIFEYLRVHHYRQVNIRNALKVESGLDPDHSYYDALETMAKTQDEKDAAREELLGESTDDGFDEPDPEELEFSQHGDWDKLSETDFNEDVDDSQFSDDNVLELFGLGEK